MLDDSAYDRWLVAARNALQLADLARGGGRHEWACFTSEQAAQLAFKGLLHGIGRPTAAWGHDVVSLARRVAEALGGDLDQATAEAVGELSKHYIPARYPDAYPEGGPADRYTAANADAARAQATLVIAFVEDAWRALTEAAAAAPTTPPEEAS